MMRNFTLRQVSAALLAGAGIALASTASAQVAALADSTIPVDVSADGSLLLSTGENHAGLVLTEVATGKDLPITDGRNAGYYATISPKNDFVCFKAFQEMEDGTFLQQPMLYDIEAGEQLPLFMFTTSAGTPAVAPNGDIAFTVDEWLVVLDEDLETKEVYDLGHYVNTIAYAPGSDKIAYNTIDEQIAVLDLASGNSVVVTDNRASYWVPEFSPKGDKILIGGFGRAIIADAAGSGMTVVGEGQPVGWMDNNTAAVLQVIADNKGEPQRTELLGVSAAGDPLSSTVLSSTGAAAAAVSPALLVSAADGGARMAAIRNGVVDTMLATPQVASPAGGATAARIELVKRDLPEVAEKSLADLRDDGTKVYMVNVPYVNQVYDTPSWHNGHWSCNATAAIMCLAYNGLVPSRSEGYGWYVPNVYTNNGVTYNICSADPNGNCGWGGYGYIVRNNWADTKGYMRDYFINHGATSAVDWSPTFQKAKDEINAGRPFVILTSLTAAGHYITCIGYYKYQYTLFFNDPYGDKNYQYPGPYGYDSAYDWPGYNNGWMNLNTVHCYIWCRYDSTPPWQAEYVANTFAPTMNANEIKTVSVTYKNTGTQTWTSMTRLATADPRGRSSLFNYNWLSNDRVVAVSGTVAPGSNYTFSFQVKAPTTAQSYAEGFELVQDGVSWFEGSGDNVTMYTTVIADAPPATPQNPSASPNSGSASLSWSAVGDSDLQGYNIYRATFGSAYTKINSTPVTSTSYTAGGLTNGTAYLFRIRAIDNGNQESGDSETVMAIPHAQSFIRIQAEDYDLGGNDVGYKDLTSGNTGGAYRSDWVDIASGGGQTYLGWIDTGEWTNYGKIRGTGKSYFAQARVASAVGGGAITIKINGTTAISNITVPNTGGWETFVTLSLGNLTIPAGATVQLFCSPGSFNVDYLQFTEQQTIDNDEGSPVYTENAAWYLSSSSGYNGGTYKYAYVGADRTATWAVPVPATGTYKVEVIYRAGANRASAAKYVIGSTPVYVNQQQNNLTWVNVGNFSLSAGTTNIQLQATGSSGGTVVIADAVRITRVN